MMTIDLYQIDAFTQTTFGGNPAAVCPLKEWLPDRQMRSIARENNLAETAFFVRSSSDTWQLRWFTPEIEMDLCGHATLASAHVIFEELKVKQRIIYFDTRAGRLRVVREGALLQMDLPARPPVAATLPEVIRLSLSHAPTEIWKARDYLLVYPSAEEVRNMEVDRRIMDQINIDPGGVIITAKGEHVHFVSRFFTPQASIFEDPVTGSAHCTLVPFWASRLGQHRLQALQLSARQGKLYCRLDGDRVWVGGHTVKYLQARVVI